ncbi:HTH-type transcriptional repressor KstR2 [Anaerotignum neopropionicum]|uniref:HTH-type transcriptional repressor KstR2 n=1 Tax=Anaerotignum neopropionicum TaxID=36847 RepID=A0A136WCM5_9FIRM|nr:TetR/AcrR family transcriptional regulator [Anaerotignum neopropionicum]KXL52268.1 HTH-type transcriptional repressor KstR2 [Anaerotignum neopropionicum]
MARNKYPEETIRLILDVAQRLFLKKGYEDTSIQDIIDGLGGLSKGAVYHHFKSKEEIFNAVGDRYNEQIIRGLKAVRDDPVLTGHAKLKKMFSLSLSSSDRDIVFTMAPNMLENPKLLAMQMREIFSDVVPHYMQPVIEQGVADGSIHTEYPKELSEAITMLTNLWLNPLVIETDVDSMEKRVRFFNLMLKNMGIELLDEQMLESYRRYCTLANQKNV